MLVVRGDEHDRHRRAGGDQTLGHLETREPGHLHIQEDEIGLVFVDSLDGIRPVARLRHDRDAPHLIEQVADLLAGQRLIVDNNGPEIRVRHWLAPRPRQCPESPA